MQLPDGGRRQRMVRAGHPGAKHGVQGLPPADGTCILADITVLGPAATGEPWPSFSSGPARLVLLLELRRPVPG